MAVGSFALGEAKTPANIQVETQSAAANDGTGDFVVDDMTGCSFSGGVLTIGEGASPIISMKPGVTSTTQRIEVTGESTIILNGVKIDRSSEAEAEPKAALTIADDATFDVTITLADGSVNTLNGEDGIDELGLDTSGSPGIEKSNDKSADATKLGKLTIGGTGQLNASGGVQAAGIGGRNDESASKIAIESGTVIASGKYAAGIGGEAEQSGSYIWITGGDVTATATSTGNLGAGTGAGIGGGGGASGSYIWITGGKVKATALYLGAGLGGNSSSGAGIGGGGVGSGSYIYISGGEVTSTGANFGSGIGGGFGGKGSNIYISGGVVTATGKYAGAGIGGGGQANGEKIEITGGVIKATGGLYMTYPAAGIGGGGMGSASDNKLDGDAVVMAASGGENKDALEGFENNLTKGITVTGVVTDYTTDPYTIDWKKGELHGTAMAINEDAKLPVDFTITSNAALTVGKNAEGKEATLSMAEGKKLTVEGSLTNEGIINIPAENLFCTGSGKVTTLLNYDPQGGEIVTTNEDEYITYKDSDSVKTYGTLKNATKEGCDFEGWYTQASGQGTKVEEGKPVLLNQHTLYANWITEPAPTPTPPTPTPPEPTPPGPTPEPTPDPSVNPDGDGSGSGASSKTGDPFMGGMALALLGVATTGAILTRKLR